MKAPERKPLKVWVLLGDTGKPEWVTWGCAKQAAEDQLGGSVVRATLTLSGSGKKK